MNIVLRRILLFKIQRRCTNIYRYIKKPIRVSHVFVFAGQQGGCFILYSVLPTEDGESSLFVATPAGERRGLLYSKICIS